MIVYRKHAWFRVCWNHNVKNTRLHLIPNEKLSVVVTIFTPIPKWLHPSHRFQAECLRIVSRMLSEEVTRTQKECIRNFVGSIDAAGHGLGATICKYVVSGMSLFRVSLAMTRMREGE